MWAKKYLFTKILNYQELAFSAYTINTTDVHQPLSTCDRISGKLVLVLWVHLAELSAFLQLNNTLQPTCEHKDIGYLCIMFLWTSILSTEADAGLINGESESLLNIIDTKMGKGGLYGGMYPPLFLQKSQPGSPTLCNAAIDPTCL